MAELKTKVNDASVSDFLNSVEHTQRREDSLVILDMMKEATGTEPKMWGTTIVGFGIHHYTYESGREADWFQVGFSPRKRQLVLYIMPGFSRYEELLSQLGKHKTGKSCLYINKLDDIDQNVLKELIEASINELHERHPTSSD